MQVTEVNNSEVNRLDLLLVRTMGSDTSKNRAYFYYLNPSVDFTNLKAGLVVNIPEQGDMSKFKCLRCYFLNSYTGS